MLTPTTFGTPRSQSALRVLLLGSGELGKELAIAFTRLGVEVHAADRYQNAPAQQVAHYSYTLDMTDGQQVDLLVKKVRPHFVIPEIEAIATDTLEKIAASSQVTVIPTAHATRLTMDREGIRRLAAEELGIPTSPYLFASGEEEMRQAVEKIGLPCIVKPVMSSSGKGQSLLRTHEDIASAWHYALEGGRGSSQGRVIVEGLVKFDYEITLLTVRSLDNKTGKIVTNFCEPIGHLQVDGDYHESWQPVPMDSTVLEKAQAIAEKVTHALGGRGLFGVELFICGDEVLFSEVSPRPHDTGMVTMASGYLSEFELHARAILGLPVDTRLRTPAASAVICAPLATAAPVYRGLASALSLPEVDLRLFGKPDSRPGRRMGVALARGKNIAQARERAKQAAELITIQDA
ncbi:formate-dependent phosphoribosylglycinamide formyltransferase [Varibaculum vaginae]|uniref:formate-dependent phosphoribosylglycinamide formyltransferase n=1 Tax=Varibaculum vaginae TaxID=2364797 RepID=UPI000F08E628|nr:formate-dependent phosphoribosylglycinamide formyltransferase [Varibaculum vaginae]